MAGYKIHITAALLFCGVLYFFPFWDSLSWSGKLICAGIAVFFGLWPDVDTKSKGQYIFLLLVFTANLLLIYQHDYQRAAYLGLLVIFPILSRHRGWTHSYYAMFLVPLGFYLAAVHYNEGQSTNLLPYLLAAILGYASHLVTDKLI